MTKRSVTKKPNLTQWITGKPVRKGVYQIIPSYLSTNAVRYSYWNGKKWSWFAKDIARFENLKDPFVRTKHPHLFRFRGLAVKP
jgi:hypothetical protein